MATNLNNEAETFRVLRRVPLSQLLDIIQEELGYGPYLQNRMGHWTPTVECWKIIRRHGWTSKEFMTETRYD